MHPVDTRFDLSERTAVVTGASGGIGLGIARAFARAGADVYLAGRSRDRLDEAVAGIGEAGGRATSVALDVRDPAALEGLVRRAAEETGRLNVLVSNAGLDYPSSLAEGDPERWREMLEVNVLAVLVGARAAIRTMRELGCPGHIVNVSSIHGRMEGTGVYGATKAAVNSISRTLRQELEDDPIRVLNVIPGGTATSFARNFPPQVIDMIRAVLPQGVEVREGEPFPEEAVEALRRNAPQIMASVDEVAEAVLYAVSQPIELNVFEIEVRPQKHVVLGA